ncbi:MAG: NSS family neurotransmitter:Na+ symporter, partial [Saprospiraceae bacterium]
GKALTIMFFLGLALAGFSSMIAQLEMTVRTFVDAGLKRSTSIMLIIAVSYLIGIPSAINLNILANQDFVWGLALLISGGFCAFTMIRFKTKRIRTEVLSQNPDDIQPGRLWDMVIKYFVPAASILLLGWWLIYDGANKQWYDPFAQSSIMTCLIQWVLVLGILIGLNRWIVQRTKRE